MADDPEVPADDAALERLLRQLRFAPLSPGDSNPWDFVRRWPRSIREQRVWPIVSRLLVDSDAVVRARCLEFIDIWSEGMKLAAPRVAEVGERRPELFGADVVDGIALRDQYARTASTLSLRAEGARLAAVLRGMSANEPLGGSAAAVIAEHDPAFVIAQTKKWGPRARDWALAAARAFAAERPAQLIDFLRAASGLDADAREEILTRVEQVIDRQAAGRPTERECRAAIGL